MTQLTQQGAVDGIMLDATPKGAVDGVMANVAPSNSPTRGNNILRKREVRVKHNKFTGDETWMTHKAAWESMKGVEPGKEVIFDSIEIADDGGLGKIAVPKGSEQPELLWYMSRPISAIVVLAFIFYNCFFILNNAKNVIYGIEVKWSDLTFEKLSDIGVKTELATDDYLVTTWFIYKITGGAWDLTQLASKAIVLIEVAMMALLYIFVVIRLLQASVFTCLCCTCCGKQRWKRWFYIAGFFFDSVPSLTSFSAMRLLYYIVPQVATQHLFTVLFYTADYVVLWLVWFVASRGLCLVVGLDCFLIKYRAASTAILHQNQLEVMNVLNAAILLNQVLGAVQLTWAVRDRLFRFVFGGQDGVMTQPEIVRRDTWNAKVMQRIWRSYPCWKAFSISMTWSDDDFQHLVVRDLAEHEKSEMRVKDSPV